MAGGEGAGQGDLGQWFPGSIKKRSVYQNVITCVIWSIKKRFIHIDTPPPIPRQERD